MIMYTLLLSLFLIVTSSVSQDVDSSLVPDGIQWQFDISSGDIKGYNTELLITREGYLTIYKNRGLIKEDTIFFNIYNFRINDVVQIRVQATNNKLTSEWSDYSDAIQITATGFKELE